MSAEYSLHYVVKRVRILHWAGIIFLSIGILLPALLLSGASRYDICILQLVLVALSIIVYIKVILGCSKLGRSLETDTSSCPKCGYMIDENPVETQHINRCPECGELYTKIAGKENLAILAAFKAENGGENSLFRAAKLTCEFLLGGLFCGIACLLLHLSPVIESGILLVCIVATCFSKYNFEKHTLQLHKLQQRELEQLINKT